MQRDELISSRSSGGFQLRQSESSARALTLLHQTRDGCFGQGRCRLSPHLDTDRHTKFSASFIQALPSTTHALPAESEEHCVLPFLPHSLPRVFSKHTQGIPGIELLYYRVGTAHQVPAEHG